ncbi:lysozyme [Asticcacaulis sp.]|uniref:lysozyme n=1 Tax=Asticcacaulis sp. TaxID=1872648 RepID=UPI0031D36938
MNKLKGRLVKGGMGAGAAAITAALLLTIVPKHEGKENDPYLDIVKVRTVCYGHTGNVENRRYGDAECLEILEADLVKHAGPVLECTPSLKDKPYALAAATSLAFNVGTSAYCRSTADRRFDAGDVKGGCEALTWFNKAGGKVVKGLVKRRADERALCERDT